MLSAQELLGRAYEAFNARDIDGALDTVRADVDGRQYWTRQWTMINPRVGALQFRLEEMN
jgi:hypothetical protein